MIRPTKRPVLEENHNAVKNNIGALSLLIFGAGFLIYANTLWRYRLVIRDEACILGIPAPFIYVGITFSIITLFIIWFIAKWAMGKEQIRISLSQREDFWPPVFVILGVTLGTVGAAFFINSHFDTSAVQSHQSTILHLYTYTGSRGGPRYSIVLSDWRNKRPETEVIELAAAAEEFRAHRVQEKVIIQTKKGFLGYEWIVSHG